MGASSSSSATSSTPAQVLRLTASFRDAVGRNAPVLVDQEGGRVQRLGPPHWPAYPPRRRLWTHLRPRRGDGPDGGASRRAPDRQRSPRARHRRRLPADRRRAGRRRQSRDRRSRLWRARRSKVAALGGAVADGPAGRRRAAGAQAHPRPRPRHGRQPRRLPVVETDRATLDATDFAAFRPLSDLPLGMTAHVVFTAIDPLAPATTSVTMVREVIRGLDWDFSGLLMSDDISMGALSGSHRRAHARGDRGRLRRRAPLQRQARGDAGGRGGGARARRRSRRTRRRRARPSRAARGARSFGAARGMGGAHECALGCRRGRPECDRMTADEIKFEADLTGDPAPSAPPTSRRWWSMSRASRDRSISCCARAPAEGRSRQDLDPGAGGPVPRLHRGGAQAAARARRRLSRDGGLARLSEVAAAAARHPRARRAERRGHGECAGAAAQASRSDPRRGRAPVRAARSSIATCSRRGQPEPIAHIKHPQWTATLYDLLSAYAQQRQKTRALACAARQAHGLVAGRGARGAGAADRPVAPTGRGSTNI